MKLGFIGAGNMGSAIIRGILRNGILPAQEIGISRKHPELSADFSAQALFYFRYSAPLATASAASF